MDLRGILALIDRRRRDLSLSEAELLRRAKLGPTFLRDVRRDLDDGKARSIDTPNLYALAEAAELPVQALIGEGVLRAGVEEPARGGAGGLIAMLPEKSAVPAEAGFTLEVQEHRPAWPFSARYLGDELGIDAREAFVMDLDGALTLVAPLAVGEAPFGALVLWRGDRAILRTVERAFGPPGAPARAKLTDSAGKSEETEMAWLTVIGRAVLAVTRL